MDFVKKEWQFRDIISENELNRMEDGIEEGITKAEQAQQIANEAKATADDVQSELSAHISATTGVHGATSAATPNTIVQRDANGRFKAAAPSASDDVARKAETDAALAAAQEAQTTADAALPKSGGYMTGDLGTRNIIPAIEASPWLYGLHIGDGTGYRFPFRKWDNTPIAYMNDSGELFLTPSFHRAWHAGNDGAGSGLDSDMLDGMQPSTSASANTIVQRDSSGRIKAAAPSASDDVVRKAELDGHANRTDNPHGVTKAQVGLSNVQNYGIATQAQAEAGTANNVYMTPLRTKQAIDQFVPIETGTWTPELRFGGSTSGITYTFRAGWYTRIANVVYWTFNIVLSSKGSASGVATIVGLPFSNNSSVISFYHAVGQARNISVPSGQWLSSYVSLTNVTPVTSTDDFLTSSDFSNNSSLYASGFYFI